MASAIDKELVRPAIRARIESEVSEIAKRRRGYDEVVSSALETFREKYRLVSRRMPQLLEAFLRVRQRHQDPKSGAGQSPKQAMPWDCYGNFTEGATVEYWSKGKGYWMMAMVVRRLSTGEYDLTVKKKAAAQNIRIAIPFCQGSSVLFCVDHASNNWLAATVTAINADGTFDLEAGGEVRASVKLEFLRWPDPAIDHTSRRERSRSPRRQSNGSPQLEQWSNWEGTFGSGAVHGDWCDSWHEAIAPVQAEWQDRWE